MKVGLAQILVEGGEPLRNLERARIMIERAVSNGCDLVLLPETLDLAWTHPSALDESESIPGSRSNFFCKIAKEFNVWICMGLSELEIDKRFNTALLINRQGEIKLKHRKINLLEVEFPYYEPGRKLEVVDTEFGLIGVNICADNYMEALCLGHSLARMGAQIILSPSSWTVDFSITEEMDPYKEKWIAPFLQLAKTYEIPVVSTTSVGYIVGGPYEGKKMVGCSLVVDKEGAVLQGTFNEFAGDLMVVELNLGLRKWKGTEFGKRIREQFGLTMIPKIF